ncbi:MAG: calcium-binding protein [Pseudodonghicola sp.]
MEHFTFADDFGADNTIITGAGDDMLYGGDGDDVLNCGSGDDTVNGGDGMDSFGADLSGWSNAATINLNVISTLINGTVRDMEGFETLTTGSGDDVITGHRTSYMADTIDTGAGNDLVKLWWNGEKDVVAGGQGGDVLQVTASKGVFLIDLTAEATGGYSGHFSTGYTGEGVYFSGIESFVFTDWARADNTITTGAGNDVLIGGGGRDTLNGGGGDDILSGGLLRDVLIGSAGRDDIDGGGGNDVLRGGRGADVLIGGIGNDRLSGGTLADRFVFGQGDGNDTILDFGDGADRIVIEDGAESFADVTVEDAGADTIVRFADVSITLLNVDHLSIGSGDFLFL